MIDNSVNHNYTRNALQFSKDELLDLVGDMESRVEDVSEADEGNLTVVEAISGPDGKVSFKEMRKAIEYWSNDEPVPETGGKKVTYMDLRKLFRMWKKNKED